MTEYSYTPKPGTVYFVGAGPGAPDLITVRGKDIIAQADLILYADSLVEESVATLARKPEATHRRIIRPTFGTDVRADGQHGASGWRCSSGA